MNMIAKMKIKRIARLVAMQAATAVGLGLIASATVQAAWPNLPSTPLAVQSIGDPNLILTLDDSGSMASAFAPDGISGDYNLKRWLSPRYNSMAYDPFDKYDAPYSPTLDGTRLPTSFTAAWVNGFQTSRGSTNLSSAYRVVRTFDPSNGSTSLVATSTYAAQAAFIYSFYADLGSGDALPAPGTDPSAFVRRTTVPAGCGGVNDINNENCYVKIVIPAAHQQNFANWYSFYKTRNLAVASAANIALYDLNPKYRVTWQTLNNCRGFNIGSCNGHDGVARPNKLRRLDDATHKSNLYQYLVRLPASNSTPLRRAVERAGDFIKTTGIESPRANQLGVSESGPDSAPISACRSNYHVLLTDGIWNSTANSTSVGNADATARTLPDTQSYLSRAPYGDANSNSVADLAFAQWATDAQPSLSNSVIPYYPDPVTNTNYWDARNDPASWQHMNTFSIGLGLNGFLNGSTSGAGYLPKWGGSTYVGDYAGLANGSIAWPSTYDDSPGNVADLWHAALNGRGEFFGADSPSAIREAFRKILARISAASTSSGQIASSSKRATSDTLSFDVSYRSLEWYSTLSARKVYSDGSVGPVIWNTDGTLTSDSPSRSIFTWDPVAAGGRAFAYANFTTAEKLSYFNNDTDLLSYLRGNRSQEGIKFRGRVQLLGDVVSSELVAASKTDQGYGFLPTAAGGGSYRAYVAGKKSVAFVGSNDGMLHAFGTDGAELFGYVPYAVLPKMKALSQAPLVRQPLVDGPITISDIYVGGTWKTVIVGGLGGGGSSVFGLDVTSVTQGSGSGSFGSSNVLFDVTDPEMGYSFSKPVIGRTVNGNWVAIWGNGYGGLSNRAMLFVYDFSSKALTKIDTGVGTVADPNGMGSPVGVEFSAGNIVAVFAGDYKGNLWKFTLSGSSFVRANGSTPFFQAADSGGKAQPITAAPEAAPHPAGGIMLLFGTGKFFEAQDRTNRDVQSFYAVRDTGQTTTTTRANLVAQTIVTGTNLTDANRTVSLNDVDYTTKRGWRIDFNTTLAAGASGERVVARPLLLGDIVAYATYAPGSNPCEGAGLGYLMFSNVFTGGLPVPFLDTNGDGAINSADKPASGPNYAGVKIAGDGSLLSPIATLVGVQDPGIRGGSGSGATCGGDGQPPCVAGTPSPANPSGQAGCNPGLIDKSGTCRKPNCDRGNIVVGVGSTGPCAGGPETKYPRWMELKWSN